MENSGSTLTARKHDEYGAVVVSISNLWGSVDPSTGTENYNRIYNSIKEGGLQNPIVLWSTTNSAWNEYVEQNPGLSRYPGRTGVIYRHKILVVLCGNNRTQIAADLGYTEISAIICNSTGEVSTWCSKFRKEWKNAESG